MLKKACTHLSCAVCLCLALLSPALAEELIIGGTGSSGPLVQILFDEFHKKTPDVTLKLIAPPMGTNGALKALEQDRIHLVMVGRPLAKEELARFGKHFRLADTPFVMASKNGLRRGGFTLEELAQVYTGHLTKWDDGKPIRLVMRGAFESDTLLLKGMSTGLSMALDEARKRPGMSGAVNDLDTVTLLDATPGSFGPTTLGLLTTMGVRLQVFPLNGVAPTLANFQSGKYPWHKNLTVVLPHRPSPAATRFEAFLRSDQAKKVMLKNDYLPAKP